MNQLIGKYRIHTMPRSKYGFADMEVGDVRVVSGIYSIIRISADGFRKRWNIWFYTTDLGNGQVKIERYK